MTNNWLNKVLLILILSIKGLSYAQVSTEQEDKVSNILIYGDLSKAFAYQGDDPKQERLFAIIFPQTTLEFRPSIGIPDNEYIIGFLAIGSQRYNKEFLDATSMSEKDKHFVSIIEYITCKPARSRNKQVISLYNYYSSKPIESKKSGGHYWKDKLMSRLILDESEDNIKPGTYAPGKNHFSILIPSPPNNTIQKDEGTYNILWGHHVNYLFSKSSHLEETLIETAQKLCFRLFRA
ncbi:MAG TPA: hypothetical protein PKC21_03020 [Oligoflexia bacterium]|nr:hypothetical protein [Oligoflexia bacterium]HMR24305.1 hypothetical protein [Oligoflexia bacterium]